LLIWLIFLGGSNSHREVSGRRLDVDRLGYALGVSLLLVTKTREHNVETASIFIMNSKYCSVWALHFSNCAKMGCEVAYSLDIYRVAQVPSSTICYPSFGLSLQFIVPTRSIMVSTTSLSLDIIDMNMIFWPLEKLLLWRMNKWRGVSCEFLIL